MILRKKNESKFPVDMNIYTLCPSLLPSFTKFCWVVSEELRWQVKQDWRTDWLTDGSKTLYPQQLVAWGIITTCTSKCECTVADFQYFQYSKIFFLKIIYSLFTECLTHVFIEKIKFRMQLLTSSVCIRFGLMASFINTVNAPLTPYLKQQMKE